MKILGFYKITPKFSAVMQTAAVFSVQQKPFYSDSVTLIVRYLIKKKEK